MEAIGVFEREDEDRVSVTSSKSENEADWRNEVEYGTKIVHVGEYEVQVVQMDELPVAASLFMLAEMNENTSEISGTRLWSGSYCLARYLEMHQEVVKGKNTLELGAGTGLCSIMSKKLGSSTSIATDGDEEVVDLLRQNMKANDVDVHAHSLFWGDATATTFFLDKFPAAYKTTNIILAGDVLYKQELLPLFFSTVRDVMKQSDECTLLLCHIPRADVSHQNVQDKMTDVGLHFVELDLPSIPANSVKPTPDDRELEECPVEDMSRAKLYKATLQ